jgi:hypothetical protein
MEVDGQLVSYDNRRLDAAREVGEAGGHRESRSERGSPRFDNRTNMGGTIQKAHEFWAEQK